ncbi:MAG: hypothetical protein C4547_00315 [Phycisphaerales bacterium]|nr:MAG: hypothetical protein C4547_00315 [Phycisphaerales bacterium]
MTLELLRGFLAKRPFQPFRLVTSSGQVYDVIHPENAILVKGGLVVAYGAKSSDLPDRVATLSLPHIAAVGDAAEPGARRP